MVVKRIFAASAKQNHITLGKLARNTKSSKKQANAGSALQKFSNLLLLSNLHSEMFAGSKNALN
jgi:hypothetical protein